MKQKFKLISAIMFTGILMAIFSIKPVTGSSTTGKVGKLSMAEKQALIDFARLMRRPPAYIGAPMEFTNQNVFIGAHSSGTKNLFSGNSNGRINNTGSNTFFIGSRSGHAITLRGALNSF